MATENQKPQYMIIYKCAACGQESGFTERDNPSCRHCDSKDPMEVISKNELTAEVMAERLKALTDSMMKNLQSAYDILPDVDVEAKEGLDPEEEMLKLLARVQKIQDKIQNLDLKKGDDSPM